MKRALLGLSFAAFFSASAFAAEGEKSFLAISRQDLTDGKTLAARMIDEAAGPLLNEAAALEVENKDVDALRYRYAAAAFTMTENDVQHYCLMRMLVHACTEESRKSLDLLMAWLTREIVYLQKKNADLAEWGKTDGPDDSRFRGLFEKGMNISQRSEEYLQSQLIQLEIFKKERFS